MAKIVLSHSDVQAIEEVLRYLDPASNEVILGLSEAMSDSDWEFAVTYMKRRIRSALEIEMMARCMIQASMDRNLCDERGADHYLRSKAWTHNYGVVQTADEYFTAISSANGGKLSQVLEALILIAQDRMFGSLDEEYERLLHPRS